VTVRRSDGVTETFEIDDSDYPRVGHGPTIPVRRGALDWRLGSQPTLSIWHVLVTGFGTLVVWTLYRRRRQASRPWYRRRVHEQGSGRLPGR
jgi:hypothetical protein